MRHTNGLWLHLAFLAGVFSLTACGDRQAGVETTNDPIELRVMTFNIEWGGTNISFEQVVEAVRRSDADIVGIQEAEGNLQRLAADLGWHYSARNYAIAKYPLIEPQGANGKYVLVEVAPGKVVALANVHLPSDPYGPQRIRDGAARADVLALERTVRMPAIQQYLEILPALVARGIPVFLTGDFNAPSHQDWTEAAVGTRPALRYAVDWPVSRAVANAGFRDSWREVHENPVAYPGLTWWAARPPLAAYAPGENDPQDRIDFVWFAGPSEVRESAIVGEEGRDDVSISVTPWPSDHRGVVSTFTVTPATMPELLSTGRRVYASDEDVELIFNGAIQQASVSISRLSTNGANVAVGEQTVKSGVRTRVTSIDLSPGHYLISVTGQKGDSLQNEFWVVDSNRAPVIEVVGTEFKVGQPIPVTWGNAPGNRNDYVAVYVPGAEAQYEAQDYETGLPWAYIGALPEGRLRLDSSNAGWGWPLAPGTYVMRLMKDDGYAILAESASFVIR